MVGKGATRPAGQGHVRAFDGLRVTCALMIVLMHLAARCGLMVSDRGEKGPLYDVLGHFEITVDLFFVISGFVLYRPWAAAALGGRPRPSAATYYRRRFLRIFPAYWLLLLGTVLCYERDLLKDGWRLLRVLTLQHSWDVGDFASQTAPQAAFGPTWSLAVEIQFYFLLPLVGLALHRLLTSRFGPAPAMLALGALPASSIAWTVWSQQLPVGEGWAMRTMSLPAHVGYFGLGMMGAVLAVRGQSGSRPPGPVVRLVQRRPWAVWAVGGAAFVSLPLTPLTPEWGEWPSVGQSLAQVVVYFVTACTLCAPLMLAPGSGPARLMSRPLLSRLTRLSYGIYLWHMFVIQLIIQTILDRRFGTFGMGSFLLLLPVTVALTMLLAALSYLLVQKPLLDRFAGRRPSRGSESEVRRAAPPVPGEDTAVPRSGQVPDADPPKPVGSA